MSVNDPLLVESEDEEEYCIRNVTSVFPDICPDYLRNLASKHGFDAPTVISIIVDQEEDRKPYPRRVKNNALKRKRDDGKVPEAEALRIQSKYDNPERRAKPVSSAQAQEVELILKKDFYFIPAKVTKNKMTESKQLLLPAYLALFQIACEEDLGVSKWMPLHMKNQICRQRAAGNSERYEANNPDPTGDNLAEELMWARSICIAKLDKCLAEKAQEQAENRNYEKAKLRGEIAECECCFLEFALNRLVHCNGETTHLFCTHCTRRHAETQIGLSKYEVQCLSMDQCSAGFSPDERCKFLDDNLTAALDRIEKEDVLRLANLEDLSCCPFCPYAAICPPVEVDKEFRCLNPECEIVSCRLCKAKTHVPQSCEEFEMEKGYTARRKIEEAMSAALIRRCNKCSTPFIKEFGCNKMTCTRQGCSNIQCYVCSKSCTYDHFDDVSRGGKIGNCPLFDKVENRHQAEVKEAELQTRAQVIKENPHLDPGVLEFKIVEPVAPAKKISRRAPKGQYRRRAGIHGRMPVPRLREAAAPLNPAPQNEAIQDPNPQRRPFLPFLQRVLADDPPLPQPVGAPNGVLGSPALPNMDPALPQMNHDMGQDMNPNMDENMIDFPHSAQTYGTTITMTHVSREEIEQRMAPLARIIARRRDEERNVEQQMRQRNDEIMARRAERGGAVMEEVARARTRAETARIQMLNHRLSMNMQAAAVQPAYAPAANQQRVLRSMGLNVPQYPAGAANQQ
ncbi:E3 ubiquitin-protein ligase-like protein [Cladobotryum mycophilum]|uniref:E3 ubiquitin-protein ligase-like protein n=1 Tax=Cladobotryum mycophilum TaxID=491253 RepID=A0ABR0S753_9HYPO